MNTIRRRLATLGMALGMTAGALAGLTGPAHAGPVATTPVAAANYANGQDPVIMVHGLFGAAWNWNSMKSKLTAAGYSPDQLFTFQYDTTTQSNVVTASKLAAKVKDVLAATGASKVDIVGHSMGSLNSRFCIKYDGCAGHVDDWISLGGPNNGTTSANLAFWMITCREMAPGSAFLQKLNAGAPLPDGVDGTVIWSRDDGVVMPASSAVIEGLENIEVPGVSHLGLLSDPGVAGLVLKALAD